MAGPLNSPYSARPSAVAAPVPGQEQQSELDQFLAEIKAPQMQEAAPVPEPVPAPQQTSELDQLLQEQAQNVPASQDFQVEQPSSFMGIDTDLKQQIEDIPIRIATKIAGDPESVKLTLEKFVGPENVKQSGGKFFFRKPGRKAFKELDPTTFEIVNDLFSDLYKEHLQVLGGATGAAVSGPAAFFGTAAGVAGATAAVKAAEPALGVVRPTPKDQSLGGQLKRAAAATGEAVVEGVTFAMGDKLLATMGGAIANKLGKGALNESRVASQEVMQTAQDVAAASQGLSDAGIHVSQGNFVLSPGQMTGNLYPEAKKLDTILSAEGPAKDVLVNQGRLMERGWNKLKASIANTAGKSTEDAFQGAKEAAKAARDAEGQLIGTFRDQALKASKGKALPMPETVKQVNTLVESFGFKVKKGNLVPPTTEQLKAKFPDATDASLNKVRTLLTGIKTTIQKNNGNMKLAQVDTFYRALRGTIDDLSGSNNGRQVAGRLIGIKDALRDDWAAQIGTELASSNPNALPAYKAAMQNYSEILNSQKLLKNVLKKDELSVAAFAEQIMSPTQGKSNVKQLKVLLDHTDNEIWPRLVQQKLDNLTAGAIDKNGRMDWAKLNRSVQQLDRAEILDQMVSPAQKKTLNDFFTIAKHVDSNFKFGEGKAPSSAAVKGVKALLLALSPVSVLAKISNAENIANSTISSIGKDKALIKWLNGEGLSLVLKTATKKEQGMIKELVLPILRQNMAAQTAGATAPNLAPQPVPTPAPPQ